MTFEVMHADYRLVQRQSQSASHRSPDQQCTGQAWALRVSDGVDIAVCDAAFFEYLFQQGNGAAHVITRGQLGDDTAVFFMHRDLRMQGVSEQAFLRVV